MSNTLLPWIDSSFTVPEDPKEWCCVMYQNVPQNMPATYENGWWYWADEEADPIPAEDVMKWISIREIFKHV